MRGTREGIPQEGEGGGRSGCHERARRAREKGRDREEREDGVESRVNEEKEREREGEGEEGCGGNVSDDEGGRGRRR